MSGWVLYPLMFVAGFVSVWIGIIIAGIWINRP